MSAPIAHLLISQEGCKTFFAHRNRSHIYIGTSFPDIRHLVGAKRELTHYTPKLMLESDDFRLGMDLHNWMDEARAAYRTFMINDSYKAIAPLLFIPGVANDVAVKFFEDEVVLGMIRDKKNMVEALAKFCDEETEFHFPDESIQAWHKKIYSYILGIGGNTDEIYHEMISGDSDNVYRDMLPYLTEYRAHPIYAEFVRGEIDYILKIFQVEMGRRFQEYL